MYKALKAPIKCSTFAIATGFFLLLFFIPSIPSAYAESTFIFTRPLMMGIVHQDVKELQTFLQTAGYSPGIMDGVFGPKTKSALILFQTAHGLTADGIVGPQTIVVLSQGIPSVTTVPSALPIAPTPIPSVGCTPGNLFNTTTGAPCTNLPLSSGCTPEALFNTTTGVSCAPTESAPTPKPQPKRNDISREFIRTATIAGVIIPEHGGVPVVALVDTTEYTATVTWNTTPTVFIAGVAYTAVITLTPTAEYTLTGVSENFFSVAGATSTNAANAGVITAVFPATPLKQLTISDPSVTLSKVYDGTTTAQVTAGTLAGVVGNESVSITATATYDSATGGTGKTITVVYTLGGADAGNYIKPVDYSVATGVIIESASAPSSVTLAVGGTAPVGGVVNVALPTAGATDATGMITGWVATTADTIKFTVTDTAPATSTITVNGSAYTSGADYQVTASATGITTIIVTTTETAKATAIRTFTITGPITGSGTDALTYGVVTGADGRIWLDRNLGASRVATASNDHQAYGSLFQWGRAGDGHQLMTHTGATTGTANNANIETLSTSDTPGHANFIRNQSVPYDWRTPGNDTLWQGVSGINNVCPAGFRLPTAAEFQTLTTAAGINYNVPAYNSSLKLTLSGVHSYFFGNISNLGTGGWYWTSSVSETRASMVKFVTTPNAQTVFQEYRANGAAVRCIKD